MVSFEKKELTEAERRELAKQIKKGVEALLAGSHQYESIKWSFGNDIQHASYLPGVRPPKHEISGGVLTLEVRWKPEPLKAALKEDA